MEAVAFVPRKNLLAIKGISEAKAEKILVSNFLEKFQSIFFLMLSIFFLDNFVILDSKTCCNFYIFCSSISSTFGVLLLFPGRGSEAGANGFHNSH